VNGFLIVFLGAGIGGALRHGVDVAALRLVGPGFPHGTITVNIVGSLIKGLLAGWFAHKADPGLMWRLFLTTGILGGFTTFSAFSLDAALLALRSQLARPRDRRPVRRPLAHACNGLRAVGPRRPPFEFVLLYIH
jgi:CrcB protein